MLTDLQIQEKKDYIEQYISAKNSADGSKHDANANVTNKNIATLSAELFKDYTRQLKISLIQDRIRARFDDDLAKEFKRQLDAGEVYLNDSTGLSIYCNAISLYPFLLNGLKDLGGECDAPKHLSSFCGGYVNLVYAISAQQSGALATVGFLMCFDYFARKDYGDNYLETAKDKITAELQGVVYSINQPAGSRGYQSNFLNWTIFDKYYFNALYENFVFPDMTKPDYESVNKLQKFFMKWFNKERTKHILTFPVITASVLNDGEKLLDKDFQDFIAEELAEGNSFFIYNDTNASSLSSCCRLKNSIEDQINEFSFTLGAGGEMTGSKNVMTINLNRLIQDKRDLRTEVDKVHKYQVSVNDYFTDLYNKDMLPVFKAGYNSLDKQFLTIGINGIVEGAEYLGYTISNNPEYMKFISDTLKEISDINKENSKKYNVKFNTEFIPGENVAVVFAKKDKADGYKVTRDCYSSYIYAPEDENISILDKFEMMGGKSTEYLDGGSAYHCNLDDYPSKEQFIKLLEISSKTKCKYFCFNIKITICNDCGNIDKKTLTECPKCGSKNIDYGTRIIGYLKRISNFSTPRQKEHALRYYSKEK
jgi:anaerobic ribonucleoside-triphosphate reductase